MVHHAVQTLNGRGHATYRYAAALICTALLGGCGGSSHAKAGAGSASRGVGESLKLDNCTDWNHATVTARRTTVAQLRKFAGGPVGSSKGIRNGPVMDDEQAYGVLQRYCAKSFARGFKLYKLYTHAAAFFGH